MAWQGSGSMTTVAILDSAGTTTGVLGCPQLLIGVCEGGLVAVVHRYQHIYHLLHLRRRRSRGYTGKTSTVASAAGLKKKMKVLVAMDESDGSFYALRWALDHFFSSSQYASADLDLQGQDPNTITLVHVRKPFQPFVYPAGPGVAAVYATSSVIDAVRKAQEEIAANILSRALHICKEFKIKAETLILEGEPKERICDVAEQLQVDCVVIGSRGLGAIKRALLGSVSDYCAHYLPCAVLIVKPPTKAVQE